MQRSLQIALILACFSFAVRHVQAELVLQVGNGSALTFTAGSIASVPIFAYNSDPGSPFSLDGYDLAFEIGGDGIGIPGSPDFFDTFQGDFSGSVFGQNINSYIDTMPFVPNAYDLIVGNSGNAFLMPGSSSPTRLLDVQFSISPLTTPGSYPFIFVANATTNGSPLNAISGPGTSSVNLAIGVGSNLNQFTVTAVPEPNALLLSSVFLVAVAVRRRRNQTA